MQPFSLARKKRRNFHSCISYDTCFWSFLIVHAGKNISHWVNLSYWVDQLKYLPSNRLDKTICTRSSKWVLHIRESISFSFGNCILLDIFYYTMFLYSTRVEKKVYLQQYHKLLRYHQTGNYYYPSRYNFTGYPSNH